MLVDCFCFLNELELLEVRLNALAPYVDRFVLCESPYTFSGMKKRLYFDENKERFKQFPITHLIVHDHLDHMHCPGVRRRVPYHHQIRYMERALEKDDLVMLSDLDEIPNLRDYNGEEGIFECYEYCYYFNVFTGDTRWPGTASVKRKNFKKLSSLRKIRHYGFAPVIGTGWHFSYVISPDDIRYKIESFSDQQFNTDEIKNKIPHARTQLTNFIEDGPQGPYKIENPSGPQWLLDNRGKYEQLFYK